MTNVTFKPVILKRIAWGRMRSPSRPICAASELILFWKEYIRLGEEKHWNRAKNPS